MAEEIKRSKLQRVNANTAKKQLSNWLLAISLALTGGGFIDVFSDDNRFTVFASIGFILLGILALVASMLVVHYMEDEETDDGT